ncbi:MAG: hypothetical protein AAB131_00150, partial [Actinomycetota bacterium]
DSPLSNAASIAGDLRVGQELGTDDDFVYFDTTTTEYLMWDDAPGEFVFSDDLNVAGNLTVTGSGPYLLRNAADSTTASAAGTLYFFENSNGTGCTVLEANIPTGSVASGSYRAIEAWGRKDGTGTVTNYGLDAVARGNSAAAVGVVTNYAVYGAANGWSSGGGTTTNYGVYGTATTGGATTNYGVYGEASSGGTNWAGYFSGDLRGTANTTLGNASGHLLTITGRLTQTYTSTSTAHALTANSITTGTVHSITCTGLTTGQGISVTGPTGGTTMTGRLIYATGDLGASGALLECYGTRRATGGDGYGIYANLVTAPASGEFETYGLYATVSDATTFGADNMGVRASVTDTGVTTSGTEDNYGGKFTCSNSGSDSVTSWTYGLHASATGETAGTGSSYAYGVYATASGADTNYGVYASVSADYGVYVNHSSTTAGYAVYANGSYYG